MKTNKKNKIKKNLEVREYDSTNLINTIAGVGTFLTIGTKPPITINEDILEKNLSNVTFVIRHFL